MKVLFVNDSITNPNWGDRAAAISLRAMLGARGAVVMETITEHDLFATTFCEDSGAAAVCRVDARDRFRPFVPPVVLELRRKILRNAETSERRSLIPAAWTDFDSAARTILRQRLWPGLVRAVANCDLVVIHGDGSMVGNGIHPRSLLFLTYLIKGHLGKPTIIVNHTADFDHPVLRTIADHVYPMFDDVLFRDETSVQMCQAICKGAFAADTAFRFKPLDREAWSPLAGRFTYFDVWPDVARFDPRRPYVCIGGSSALGALGDPTPIVEGYVSLIDMLRARLDHQVVMTVSDLVDQEVFRTVAERLNLPLVGLATPTQQAVDILGNADAYVGGRWHPAIFALRGGAPVLALSAKTFKMHALVSMAGLSDAVFNVLNLQEQAPLLIQRLERYLVEGAHLRADLSTWADGMAEDSWNNVRYLNNWTDPTSFN